MELKMRSLILTLSLFLNSAFVFEACSHYQIPDWKPNLYAGNHLEMAIVRRQANQKIACDDPEFDKYICMIGDPDFISIKTDIIDKCEKWKDGTVLVDPLTSNIDNQKIIAKILDQSQTAKNRLLTSAPRKLKTPS